MKRIISLLKHTIAVVINSTPNTCTACSINIPCLVVVDPIEEYYQRAKRNWRYEWVESRSVEIGRSTYSEDVKEPR